MALALGAILLFLSVSVVSPAVSQEAAVVAPSSSGPCNPAGPYPPSALRILLPDPTTPLFSGGALSVTYEVEIANFGPSHQGTIVYFPSVFTTFPRASGGSLTLYFSPRHLAVQSGGWSSPGFASQSVAPTGGFAFSSSGHAQLSSQILAVMATASYPNLTLEVRWQWVLTQPDGSSATSGWSTPSPTATSTGGAPSVFYPAPYVSLAALPSRTRTIGSEYSATLGGMFQGRTFFLELEYPGNGSVVQSQAQTAPWGGTSFQVQILLLNYDGFLDPASYLVHIHDDCGALLYSLPVKAYFAPAATMGFVLSPASCGSLIFNGTPHASGSSWTVVPSRSAYSFSLPYCAGHSFVSWTTSGGLHIVSGSALRVSSNGTLSVRYT